MGIDLTTDLYIRFTEVYGLTNITWIYSSPIVCVKFGKLSRVGGHSKESTARCSVYRFFQRVPELQRIFTC